MGASMVAREYLIVDEMAAPQIQSAGSHQHHTRSPIMTHKQKLKNALDAIEDAIKHLKQARSYADDAGSDIDKALRNLDDADSDIRKAMRELPDD